jgi:hypothetical protein
MILGTFTWRGMEIEADHVETAWAGPTTWLNRIDTGTATGIAIVTKGIVNMTNFAPKDDLAKIELEQVFKQFKAGATP